MNAETQRRRNPIMRFFFQRRANLVDQLNGACGAVLLYTDHWLAAAITLVCGLGISLAGEHRLKRLGFR